jgi:DNA polymerase (family 10)
MDNRDVAQAFYEIADLLELKGEDPFKIRAYRKAGEAVEMVGEEVQSLVAQGRFLKVPGIGKATGEKVQELLRTGRIGYLEELRLAIPPGVRELTRVPGLGARTAQVLFARLGIDSLDRLELAARQGELRDLPGMGVKKEAAILDGLRKLKVRDERIPVGAVSPVADALADHLRRHPAVTSAAVAGSIRRRQETVGDIDLVAASAAPEAVLDYVLSLPIAGEVLERSAERLVMATSLGRRVEVVVVPPARYGISLLTMTGSGAHLAALGLTPEASHPDQSEADIYVSLGLPYIAPELREGRGEVEAARRGQLPQLITREDLKGDLHTHTRASDGTATLLQMATAARDRGHRYLAITDHSRSLVIAGGLSLERLKLQAAELKQVAKGLPELRLLHGTEVDILKDGTLDFPDEVLRELDVVVASIHSHMHLDEAAQTERLIRAIENPHVNIIGHPTGRVLNRREPYPLDMARVVEACRRTGTALEISASPARLDLSDRHAYLAKARGVKLVINTDAHAIPELDLLKHGIGQARRAWLEPADVINTMELDELLAWLAKEKG